MKGSNSMGMSDSEHNRKLNDTSSSASMKYEEDPPDADTRPSVLTGTAGFIIITEFCERLAYYGFAGSLVLFFETRMGMTNAEADIQYSAWSGACYVMPLLGGYIADVYLGRYMTILLFCVMYLVGLCLLEIASVPGEASAALVFASIYIIATGTGGIKPNVSTLGADQFDERYSRDRREKDSFFNWFYWAINLAALISYLVVAYICQNGIPTLGGQRWGFFVGYLIPCIMMALGIAVFVSGAPRYKKYPPNGSVLADAVAIIYEAVWTRRNSPIGRSGDAGLGDSHDSSSSERAPQSHVLDRASVEQGGSWNAVQVEGVKLVMRLSPFALALVPYWGLYSQMNTAFNNQACQMDLSMGDSGAQVPISALNVFDSFAIIALVPLFDQYLYPSLKAWGYPTTMLQKIGAGFLVAILAMLVAAIVESARLATAPPAGNYYDVSARDNITPCQSIDDYNPYNYQQWQAGIDGTDKPEYCWQSCDDSYTVNGVTLLNMTCIDCDDIPQMSSLSIFWQIPQFTLVGISEILSSVTAMEFFYTQAPLAMRSVSQALNLCTSALGMWLIIPLIYIVNSNPNDEWVPVNLDNGHLIDYFLLLAGLMALNQICFWWISRKYVYKTELELRRLDQLLAASTPGSIGSNGDVEDESQRGLTMRAVKNTDTGKSAAAAEDTSGRSNSDGDGSTRTLLSKRAGRGPGASGAATTGNPMLGSDETP